MDTDSELLVERIIKSEEWSTARNWGVPRPGHPEGTIGKHVLEQVLPFIDQYYENLPDYWNLVALAYLHDIGKPLTRYENGQLVGDSHSIISARIASNLGAGERLKQVIISNDRPYSYWQQLTKGDEFDQARWTEQRRQRFVGEFRRGDLDVCLLVLFHRADNAYRRANVLSPQTDAVCWFENALLTQDIVKLGELPAEGQDERRNWLPLEEIRGMNDVEFIVPWVTCDPGFEAELKKEANWGHPLHDKRAKSVARRLDCDDVLFSLEDHRKPLAVVHLTWAKFERPPWPITTFYSSWADWVDRCMYPEAEDRRTGHL